jgi:hypothetical protein
MARTTFTGPVKSLNGFEGDFTGGTENLALTGFLTTDGNATIGGDLVVDGDTTLSGNLDVASGALTVDSITTTSDVSVGGVTTVQNLEAQGDTLVQDFEAEGNATLSGTANVIIIPTSNPGVAGAIWNDEGTLKISAGA